jgi:hypothetical protein
LIVLAHHARAATPVAPWWVAAIGAVTGVIAVAWNIWRAVREGERLVLSFNVFTEDDHASTYIGFANLGTIPAHIVSVSVTRKPLWQHRTPVLRASSQHAWWRQRLWRLTRNTYTNRHVSFESEVGGMRVEPGQAVRLALIDPDPARFLDEWRWLVVQTGVRTYVQKLADLRNHSSNDPWE